MKDSFIKQEDVNELINSIEYHDSTIFKNNSDLDQNECKTSSGGIAKIGEVPYR
jgi:uncharacterized protein involved in propanediol utilization